MYYYEWQIIEKNKTHKFKCVVTQGQLQRHAVCIRNSIDDKCNYISNEYYARLDTHICARLK